MLHNLLFRDGRVVEEDVAPDRLSELSGPRTVAWAACDPESSAALDTAADLFGLPRARIEATLSHRRRDRLWWEDGYYALSTQAIRSSADGSELAHLIILASRDVVVTFSHDPDLDIKGVLADGLDHDAVARDGTAALVGNLLEWLIAGYQEAVLDIDGGVEGVEDLLFENASAAITRVQRDTYRLRRRLSLLNRAILPLREALEDLRESGTRAGGHAGRRIHGFISQLDHLIGLMESLREMLVSVMSTNINLQQNRLNVTMKKLTGWAAVIAIPTFITSWYGMNVWLPWQQELWGAVLANVLVAGAAITIYLSFRRRDWL